MNRAEWREEEKIILGQILRGEVAAQGFDGIFQIDARHRVMYERLLELEQRGEKIDRVALANELMKHGELQSIGGLSYIIEIASDRPGLRLVN